MVVMSGRHQAKTQWQLPCSSRILGQPGYPFKSNVFSCPDKPWIKFAAYLYPKSMDKNNKKNISLLVKVENPKVLLNTSIDAVIRVNAAGQLRNQVSTVDVKKSIRGKMSDKKSILGWNKLISRQEMFDKYPRLMKRGRFHIQVSVDFEFCQVELPYEPAVLGEPDGIVKVKAGHVKVHTELLRSHSTDAELQFNQTRDLDVPVFKFLWEDASVVHAALQYMYTGVINEEVCRQAMLQFAKRYGFCELLKDIEANFPSSNFYFS